MEVSIQQLGTKLSVDYATARGFIRVLELCGQAQECKRIRNDSGRGKSTVVYKISEGGTSILDQFKVQKVLEVVQLPASITEETTEQEIEEPRCTSDIDAIFSKPNQQELEDLGGELI